MIPLFKVNMSKTVLTELAPVLASGYISQGQKVEELETALWDGLRSKTRPITVNSGTSSIDLALELCGVGAGDEVISTPMTCFASNIGPIHRNAVIRWADIDPNTGLIDPASVEKLITPKTKAIIAVNWAGKYADYAALKSFGIPVIEDAAHTWDVFLHSSPVSRGDYICYSFQAIKFLTAGDGGLLIVPEDKQEEARKLRWFGLDRSKNESFRSSQNVERAGFKYHMNDISAAIALANLEVAMEAVYKHRYIAERYCRAFQDLSYATVLPFDETSSYWIFSMVLNKDIERQDFIDYLSANGITSSPVHFRNDWYTATEKFLEGSYDNVRFFNNQQINIPVGWWLTYEEEQHIIKTIKEWK